MLNAEFTSKQRQFLTLLSAGCPLPFKALRAVGLAPEDVTNALKRPEILAEVQRFANPRDLVGSPSPAHSMCTEPKQHAACPVLGGRL